MSNMDKDKDLSDFIAMGEKCGLTDEALLTFAREELVKYQNELRDKRAAARAAEKEKVESEKAKLEAEKAKLDKELELAKLKQAAPPGDGKTVKSNPNTFKFKPKIFNEKLDTLDSWFDVFDRQAGFCGLSDDTKKLHLYDCFHGKYSDSLLATGKTATYEQIKKSMLCNFNLTGNDYRKRFFECVPEKTETFASYLQRLQITFDKWIELSACEKDYEKLRDLLLCHKIFDSCNQHFVTHLLERNTSDLPAMETQATAYFQAHSGASLGKNTDSYLGASAAFPPRKGRFQNGSDRGKSKLGSFSGDGKKPWFKDKGGRDRGKTSDKESEIVCHRCSMPGHIKPNCPLSDDDAKQVKSMVSKKQGAKGNPTLPSSFSHPKIVNETTLSGNQSAAKPWETKHIYSGYLKQDNVFKPVAVLRDTGSAVHAVHERFVKEDQLLDRTQKLITFGGTSEDFRLAEIEVDTPFISGKITACVLRDYPEKFRYYDILIGNGDVLGSPVAHDPHPDIISAWNSDHTDLLPSNQVETRSSSRESKESSIKLLAIDFNISHSDIINLQRNDDSLAKYFSLLCKPAKQYKTGNTVHFELVNGVLVRVFKSNTRTVNQVVVPSSLRYKIMMLGHDSPCSGHMGVKRTSFRISSSFFWPGMSSDIRHYCKSCESCLKTKPKGKTQKAPLQISPLVSVPFTKCATDLIGPLPLTERKNMYILTLIDYSTRWVEATALKSTVSSVVAEELLNMFSRLGIPKILVSDGGPQFTSKTMEEVLGLVGICHQVTSPYHPEANGLCEKMNGTIKAMLRRLAHDNENSWDRLLQYVLFAYREVPQETTGFSPFELVYGREARGPVALVKDLWLNTQELPEAKSAFCYVWDLKKKIQHSCELACERTQTQTERSKARYDKKAKPRSFCKDDQVLLLLPTTSNKLTSQWKGPYKVLEKCNDVDYIIDINGKGKKYHINTLQEFVPRFPGRLEQDEEAPKRDELLVAAEALVHCDEALPCENTIGIVLEDASGAPVEKGKLDTIPLPTSIQTETIKDVSINTNLCRAMKEEADAMLNDYSDIFSDVPSQTHVIEHSIKLKDSTPIKKKPYPLSFSSEAIIKEEVSSMLSMDVIEKSESPFSSPIVLVKKKDGKTRFCIDFRAVNAQTISMNVPIPDQDLLFARLAKAKYFTKFDLCKGFWQIPIAEESRHITAFQAGGELYQFKMMCFGLKNAPATFNRMMFVLLGHRSDVVFFFDDVTVFHDNFHDHVVAIRDVLEIFRGANLKVKPNKTEIGFTEIQFLGHLVGNGKLKPADDNTRKIIDIKIPKTQKKVKSLMGLVAYYSKFLPHLSTIMTPISKLVGKTAPRNIRWTGECDKALLSVKKAISAPPVLKIPNLDAQFFVQVDASGTGIGAALLQEADNMLVPCMFVSRKLTDCETRYAVIERECLAIFWAVHRLSRYLLGRTFVIQSDHRPLQFLLEGKPMNPRLFRWALSLQQFDFHIQWIPGSQNILADYLSREFE